MPCATGKSLAAFWIAQALGAKTVVVAVPSLALIRQSVADWTHEFLAHNQIPDWLCVCGDESVGNLERDDFVGEVYDTGLPTHTDPKEIARRLRTPSKGSKIVFTTYQSSDKLAAAARRANIRFDLAILDEAHKTVGVRSKTFATLLREQKFKARRRLFMTATERVFRGDSDEVLSMDNEADYGKCFFQLSYKEAIAQRIISDYKILTIAVSDERVAKAIEENRILNLDPRDLDEAEARAVASGVALKRVFKVQRVTHAISFHSSIRAAERFRDQQDVLNRLPPRTTNLHISSKKTAGERADLLREFVGESRALMTNARCLTEGVDVPAIDCVVFADPKQSRIDIVQAAGRALRRYPGKDFGYILLPLIVPREMDFNEFAETTGFRRVARIVTGLSTQDERIADEFRAIQQGRIPTGKIVEISGDVPVGMRISLTRFADAISTKLWEAVARVNWRSFEEARAFVNDLKLKTVKEWFEYCRSGEKPEDIPANPRDVYEEWVSWFDWLGTESYLEKLPFEQARAFARGLKLPNKDAWTQWCQSEKRPANIPSNPNKQYPDEWDGWPDWLGNFNLSKGGSRPFKEVRAYARGLGLTSHNQWVKHCRRCKQRKLREIIGIPTNADQAYQDNGWAGWPDFLGAEKFTKRKALSFKKARAYVHTLNIPSFDAWRKYCKSGKLPTNIPKQPLGVYDEWDGWRDWLGTADREKFLPFAEARAFARSLGFTSCAEWFKFAKTKKRPKDIPYNPQGIYRNKGWRDWYDWLDFEPKIQMTA
jgi:superfamily II DNA or RNA helicase